jgi:hypothetical protein
LSFSRSFSSSICLICMRNCGSSLQTHNSQCGNEADRRGVVLVCSCRMPNTGRHASCCCTTASHAVGGLMIRMLTPPPPSFWLRLPQLTLNL